MYVEPEEYLSYVLEKLEKVCNGFSFALSQDRFVQAIARFACEVYQND
jgi:hypothetical protein